MDAALLNAVASPPRREILRQRWHQDLTAGTAGTIHQAMPDETIGAGSLQLKVLSDADLVESLRPRRRARRTGVKPEER